MIYDRKLFEAIINDTALDEVSENFIKKITKSKSNKNAIIVADFDMDLYP